ncbi:MAG: hypothetical protein ACN2B6_11870 [Rickettsiales bacterium]
MKIKCANGRYTKEYRRKQIMEILDGCELITRDVAELADMAHVSAGKILNGLYSDDLLEKRTIQKQGRGRDTAWKIKGQELARPVQSQIDKFKHARWI